MPVLTAEEILVIKKKRPALPGQLQEIDDKLRQFQASKQDLNYVNDCNKLVLQAAATVNRELGRSPSSPEDRTWRSRWDKRFHAEMRSLTVAAGLRR